MPILVDGYNVLHQSNLLGKGRGPGFLERARHALVRYIAAALGPDEAQQVTIVFDAAAQQAPTDTANEQIEHGIRVRYAHGYEDADELLEELIRRAPQPKLLQVVSSDRRIQQAAHRRRARTIGAEQWLEQLEGHRHRTPERRVPDEKPPEPTSEEEIQFWRELFE